jgi:hypothetical protein
MTPGGRKTRCGVGFSLSRMLAAPAVGGYSGARVVAGDAGPGRSMARCSIGPRVPLSLAAPTVRGYSEDAL